jgi:glycine cleavage system H lipoate-binding protein
MVAIFVVLTFAGFILVDALVQRAQARKRQAGEPAGMPLDRRAPLLHVFAPAGVYVDSGHTWLAVDTGGRARIGLDDFVRQAVGTIDEVQLPREGQIVRRGEKLFSISQGGRTAVLPAPVDGVVESVNRGISRDPALVQVDPYQRGWVCTLKPKNLAASLRQLRVAEEARAWLDNEVDRFQQFFASRAVPHAVLGEVIQDGGQLTGGALQALDEESWDLFVERFLGGASVSQQ